MDELDQYWYKRPLGADGMKRVRRIWATDLTGCPRAQQHRIHGTYPLPPHYIPYRGSLLHELCEQIILDPDCAVHLNALAFPHRHDWIMDNLAPYIQHMRDWVNNTEIDLSKVETEVKYELDLGDDFTFVRKIDALTPEWNIDFKSSTYTGRTRKGDRLSLVAGFECIKWAGEGLRKNLIVYLGNKTGEINPFKVEKTLKENIAEMWAKIDEVRQRRLMIERGVLMDIYPGFLCSFSTCRGVCRGI